MIKQFTVALVATTILGGSQLVYAGKTKPGEEDVNVPRGISVRQVNFDEHERRSDRSQLRSGSENSRNFEELSNIIDKVKSMQTRLTGLLENPNLNEQYQTLKDFQNVVSELDAYPNEVKSLR